MERKERVSHVLEAIRELKLVPISVQQRVLAIHPNTRELRTAQILTAAVNKNGGNGFSMQYITQFDRPDLGVHTIADVYMTPVSDTGTNWQMYREQFLAYKASLNCE